MSGFARLYGPRKNNQYPNSYMGKIPFDGISVMKEYQKYGIVLVFHSDMHNETGIPSSRIFEGAASSSVIISDLNPFVLEHFGDSVFYVDTSQSAKEIFKNISLIMKQIRSNPEKALEMAKRSYQIYHDNFLLEDQLLRLEALHQATWQK
jgi:spore maturation protein CgeB